MLTEILILLSAIPCGLLGAYLTNYERKIYNQYFQPIIWTLLVISAIYYTLDIKIALTTTFMIIMLLTWKYSTKYFKEKK
jgi:hypothetical protein